MGAVSAIGNTVEENFKSLTSGKAGIGKIRFLDTIHKDSIPAAEVKLSDEALKADLQLPEKAAYTRTALLALKAVKEALASSGISETKKYKTGIVSSTTVAGMVSSEKFYSKLLHTDFVNDFFNTHEVADHTEKIADYFGIKAFVTSISTACSSSANAIMFGARLIKHGICDRMIVGGTDALSKFTLNGFKTLMILDNEACKPFDNERKGLNLGEAAAYLVLESEDIVRKENKQPLAELKGYANANDAFHQTASSPEGYGAGLAMQEALDTAKLPPEAIDYVNVHGTGTANNDLSEGRAMLNIFKGKVPPFSSTKSYTGHTLAAAGSLEAVFSILSLQNNTIFPNLRFQNPMAEFDLMPETQMKSNAEIKHIMSNSFGFGGNNSVLIISSLDPEF